MGPFFGGLWFSRIGTRARVVFVAVGRASGIVRKIGWAGQAIRVLVVRWARFWKSVSWGKVVR